MIYIVENPDKRGRRSYRLIGIGPVAASYQQDRHQGSGRTLSRPALSTQSSRIIRAEHVRRTKQRYGRLFSTT